MEKNNLNSWSEELRNKTYTEIANMITCEMGELGHCRKMPVGQRKAKRAYR
jgi:hypothetical protein